MTDESWQAIVPVKSMAHAKSRLGREDLAWPFLQDCVHALKQVDVLSRIVIATSDPDVQRWADQEGCVVVPDDGHAGINAAVLHAATLAPADFGLMVIVSDLPCLTPEAVTRVLDAASRHPVSFLADAQGSGTTTWCSTTTAPPVTHFGRDSRQAHSASGAVDLVRLQGDGWAADVSAARCDVDTPEALERAIALGVGAATSLAVT